MYVYTHRPPGAAGAGARPAAAAVTGEKRKEKILIIQ